MIDRDLFAPQPTVDARYRYDVGIVDWGLNDDSFGSFIDVETATARQYVAHAKS